MKRTSFFLMCLLLPVLCRADASRSGWATQEVALATASVDTLLDLSQRSATTLREKAVKHAAQDECLARGPVILSALLEKMHLDNIGLHLLATRMVRTHEDREGIREVLLQALDSSEEDVRKWAAYSLADVPRPPDPSPVQALLDHEHTAGAALRTLGKWGVTNAFASMREGVGHEKERRRIVAVNALGDLGDPRGLPVLIQALEDPVFTVRHAARQALARMGDEAAWALLEKLEDGGSPPVFRRQALRLLADPSSAEIRERLQAWGPPEDPWIHWEWRRALNGP